MFDVFQHQVAQTITFLVLSLRSRLCSKTDFSTQITQFVQKGSNLKAHFEPRRPEQFLVGFDGLLYLTQLNSRSFDFCCSDVPKGTLARTEKCILDHPNETHNAPLLLSSTFIASFTGKAR
jgi:hypothetical protein